jgi:hypothetical protein
MIVSESDIISKSISPMIVDAVELFKRGAKIVKRYFLFVLGAMDVRIKGYVLLRRSYLTFISGRQSVKNAPFSILESLGQIHARVRELTVNDGVPVSECDGFH